MSIKADEMVVGVYYTVTKPSKHMEFQIGDRIKLFEDGAIGNCTAAGLMSKEDVKEASDGMECELSKRDN